MQGKKKRGGKTMKKQSTRLNITSVLHIAGIFTVAFFVLAVNLTEGLPYQVGDCLVRDMTGIYCPGCGGTRAVFALLRGDLIASFLYYPTLLLTILLTLYWDSILVISLIKKNEKINRLAPWWIWLFIPFLILIQWAVRNILFFTSGYDPLGDLTASLFLL